MAQVVEHLPTKTLRSNTSTNKKNNDYEFGINIEPYFLKDTCQKHKRQRNLGCCSAFLLLIKKKIFTEEAFFILQR
jgi:FPC/CPF motif-containing protein YcgG